MNLMLFLEADHGDVTERRSSSRNEDLEIHNQNTGCR